MLYGGIGGLLLLILDIYIIMQILGTTMDPGRRLIWIILVLFLPLLGPILWYLVGSKQT